MNDHVFKDCGCEVMNGTTVTRCAMHTYNTSAQINSEQRFEAILPDKDLLALVKQVLDMNQAIVNALLYPNLIVKSPRKAE